MLFMSPLRINIMVLAWSVNNEVIKETDEVAEKRMMISADGVRDGVN